MNYYIYQNEQTLGPYSRDQVLKLQAEGGIGASAHCCREGETAWQPFLEHFSTPAAVAVNSLSESECFGYNTYLLRRKFFSFLGKSFHIFNAQGATVCFSRQKAFKLKEDIRIYRDETMGQEILSIQAQNILDFSAAYAVHDPLLNVKVGALRRKGFSSLLRDAWLVLDADGIEIGQIKEDNMVLALIRRFLTDLIPQQFHLEVQGKTVAEYRQRFNPFILKLEMDFSKDTTNLLDRRLGLAAGILIASIEGRQG